MTNLLDKDFYSVEELMENRNYRIDDIFYFAEKKIIKLFARAKGYFHITYQNGNSHSSPPSLYQSDFLFIIDHKCFLSKDWKHDNFIMIKEGIIENELFGNQKIIFNENVTYSDGNYKNEGLPKWFLYEIYCSKKDLTVLDSRIKEPKENRNKPFGEMADLPTKLKIAIEVHNLFWKKLPKDMNRASKEEIVEFIQNKYRLEETPAREIYKISKPENVPTGNMDQGKKPFNLQKLLAEDAHD